MINLSIEKYHYIHTLNFLKKYFLCHKGELINDFLDKIVKEDSSVNYLGLYSASNIFEDSDLD